MQSDKSIVDCFDDLSVQCVSLANNHFFDYQVDVDCQKAYLKAKGIFSIGAGKDINEASVAKYREQYKSAIWVTVFHWNYEFEQYPQPADRE